MILQRAQPPFIVDVVFTSDEKKTYDWDYWKDGRNVINEYYKYGRISDERRFCADESDLTITIAEMREELFGGAVIGDPDGYLDWLRDTGVALESSGNEPEPE
jgi:hypothetical protein